MAARIHAVHLTGQNPAKAQAQLTVSDLRVCRLGLLGVAITALTATHQAHAVDGCKVLLCLAAPSWQAIPDCVPTIHQLHKDLAKGKPFPSCSMAGAGNTAQHRWADAPSNCPSQYTQIIEGQSGSSYACIYAGVFTVTVNGSPFTRTWWNAGDSVTEFTPYAKAVLGAWHPKYDDDLAAWLATKPAPQPCVDC